MTRVLIVEDEESMADPLAFLLRKEGFSTEIASNGPEALLAYDRSGADIVLLDLMLPGMSGTEVCKQLRSRGSVPGTRPGSWGWERPQALAELRAQPPSSPEAGP